MFHFILLILITFLSFIICTSIFCATKKQKVDGKTTSMDDPPSKKCNTKGGLLADDPDLKSLKLRAKEQKKAGGAAASLVTATKQSTLEGTDLKSLDDAGKKKEQQKVQTAITPLDQKAMSAYVNKTSVNQDGVSVTIFLGI
uniref:Uncharacterized protein n=1 Tax=Panagrolaimus superbus TaxID=310955 RepID=A0A914ZBE3_9BILA